MRRSAVIASLDSLKLPQLEGTVAFNVYDDHGTYDEPSTLTVVADPNGFSIYYTGSSAERWAMDWKELRDMCEASRMESAAERMRRATESLDEELGRQRELRGDTRRDVISITSGKSPKQDAGNGQTE